MLTYTPSTCPKCYTPNQNYSHYRNGTHLSRITLLMSGIYPTYLLLKKQRFMCKACHSTFTAKTLNVKEKSFLADTVKGLILIKAIDSQTIKTIARDGSVSEVIVQRIINQEAKRYQSYGQALPE
nr:transposase family protein [Carnobacterium iners]